jgi:hypothetical protein
MDARVVIAVRSTYQYMQAKLPQPCRTNAQAEPVNLD